VTFLQLTDQVIDIAEWRKDEEFGIYPEGKRDKTLSYCPSPAPYGFLKAGHRYLFKLSSPRAPEQFFVEIFAYLLSMEMEISVPPAFVAYNSKENQAGALIEWFLAQSYDPEGKKFEQIYTPGGEYFQEHVANFDRKKGLQHNLETVSEIMENLSKKSHYFLGNWKSWWAKTFVFDALIGNTDRHQDNWGIIEPVGSLSPVFDNGTSMGYEVRKEDFWRFDDFSYLEKYVAKGWHHMKWHLTDSVRLKHGEKHAEMLQKFIKSHPETQQVMVDCLKKVNYDVFKKILDYLVLFEIPIKLTPERAAFMLKLIHFRHQKLLKELENQ
jgi:hypothetical protein